MMNSRQLFAEPSVSSGNANSKHFLICVFVSMLVLAGCEKPEPTVDQAALQQEVINCADEKAVLVEGTGTYSRNIDSPSPEAQAFFDQGLRLTFSYYFPEALASFNAALCFDPLNPMIHWGRALAIAPNPNSRYGAVADDPQGLGLEIISQAQALALQSKDSLSEIDLELIEVLAVLFDTKTHPDQTARSAAFINATQSLYEKFPQDLEVAFLAADAIMMASPWQYFSQIDGSAINLAGKAKSIIENGIELNPGHPGLTHLHIHLMENSFTPEQAEASADRLESLTPKAGHMVHMPGHIYMRVGRYADAISTNQRSLLADEYFLQQWGDRELPTGLTYGLSARVHAPHARNFIHWGAVLQGNSELALATSQDMVASIGSDTIQRGSSQRTIASYWMTLRFFSRWQELLALEMKREYPPYLQGVLHYVRGSAFAATNDIESAEQEFLKLQTTLTDESLLTQRAAVNTASNLLNIAQHILAGDIAKAKENFELAINHYQLAVAGQDALRYMEPPDWLQSTRLSLGQAYLDVEDYAAAEFIFTEDLRLLQENGWALYGLLQSLQAQEQEEDIERIAERFGKAWESADVDLGTLD